MTVVSVYASDYEWNWETVSDINYCALSLIGNMALQKYLKLEWWQAGIVCLTLAIIKETLDQWYADDVFGRSKTWDSILDPYHGFSSRDLRMVVISVPLAWVLRYK